MPGFFFPDKVVQEKRLISLREHLTKDSNLLLEYNEIIDYFSKDIIEKVPLNENFVQETIHYLPHRTVIKS